MNYLSHIRNEFEAAIKLQLFKGAPGLHLKTIDIEPIEIGTIRYVRGFVRMSLGVDSKLEVEGMAEAQGPKRALLLAMAEGYERLCYRHYKSSVNNRLNTDAAFGLGIGYRHRSAHLRAWGEYYERSLTSQYLLEFKKPYETHTVERYFDIPALGRIYVAHGHFEERFGSGYGFTPTEAIDSAHRAAARIRDYPQELKRFRPDERIPDSLNIAMRQPHRWLECYLVGHFEK